MASSGFPRRVLILFAHPALEKSRINVNLADAVRELPGVTFHDLYEAYPDLDIDVPAEQELLLGHDAIIFQHPFFWYSTPAILKEWQDLVLTHGWAYGRDGRALAGKLFASAVTTGGSTEAYQAGGFNGHTVRELLLPVERTILLCRMRFIPPFVTHGTHQLSTSDAVAIGARYRTFITALRDDTLDLEMAAPLDRVNEDLESLIRVQTEAK